jgi:hypothetical protein
VYARLSDRRFFPFGASMTRQRELQPRAESIEETSAPNDELAILAAHRRSGSRSDKASR